MALASRDTLHSSLLQISRNYPWKARLLSLWLPATPKMHCKLTRKGKLVPKQKTKKPAKHAQRTFSSRHLCLYSLSIQLLLWRRWKRSAQLFASAQKLEGTGGYGPSAWANKHTYQFGLGKGHGSCSRSWKHAQLKDLTLLWSFTLYTV